MENKELKGGIKEMETSKKTTLRIIDIENYFKLRKRLPEEKGQDYKNTRILVEEYRTEIIKHFGFDLDKKPSKK